MRRYLVRRYCSGGLSAVDGASTAWHATKAGACGVDDLAVNPDHTSHGHASAKWRRRLGLNDIEQGLFKAPVFIHDIKSGQRLEKQHSFILPSEHMTRAVRKHGRAPFMLSSWPENTITPDLLENSVVRAAGVENVAALGLFLDAAPYSKKDSVYSWYMNILPHEKRYVLTSVRKDELCTCGCFGQCTVQAIEAHLVMSFNALALGTDALDGAALDYRAALVEYRADWSQLGMSTGFRVWSSRPHMCFKCQCVQADRFSPEAEWEPIRHNTVVSELNKHLVRVLLHRREDIVELLNATRVDARKGKGGVRGRILTLDFPQHNLCRNDRLERGGDVEDIHCSPESLPLPCSLVFYRWDHGALLRYVSRLWQVRGFRTEYVKAESMHCLDCKGVASFFAATVIRRLCKANAFHAGATAERLPIALRLLSRGLRRWYREHGRGVEGKSRIGKITQGMLGTAKAPCLAAKAAETRHSVPFFVDLLRKHAALLDARNMHGTHLLRAGEALVAIYTVMQEADRRMSPAHEARLLEQTVAFLNEWRLAGARFKPKHHMMVHMARDASTHGNPRFYWAYNDEAMNQELVEIAQSAHVPDFVPRVLSKWLICDDL